MNKVSTGDWSFLEIPPQDYIVCGKNGVSKKGREFINVLIDRIVELEEKLKQYENESNVEG